jgi:hypothetical protein
MEMRSWKQSQLPQTRNREKNQRQRRLRTGNPEVDRSKADLSVPIMSPSGITSG